MELKNIHNRKDFVKINEAGPFLSGSEGGAGSSDGFANNAKLKDTYLGKLLNGLFSGIGWLWRKSKEYFVINKLIAQLVNELLRGVILFCFANNISLKDGTKSSSEANKEGNAEGTGEETGEETGDEITTQEEETMSADELKEEIKKLGKIIGEDYNELGYAKSRLTHSESELKNLTNPKEKIAKQAQIDKLKTNYDGIQTSIKENEVELKKLKDRLTKISGQNVKPAPTGVSSFQKIEKSLKDQQFNAFSENIPPLAVGNGISPISYQEFTTKFVKIKPKQIEIGNELSAVIDNNLQNIKVTGFDQQGNVTYEINGKPGATSIQPNRLLINNFPNFNKIKKESLDFLNKFIGSYNDGSMSEENRKKMEQIYANYSMINAMSEYRRSTKVTESLDYILNEDGLIRNVGQNLAHSSGTAKVKPDEPKAGQVGLGKALAMKAGASATVGNILTKRDREKYKDKEEEFKLNIHDVNLAEIEKTVEKMDGEAPDNESVKAKVSSYVNPYNLKTIQISAEQLIGGAKTAEGGDNALRLRWNKEVTNTYAAFTNIMDIEKVNIINEYGKNLDEGKVKKSVDNKVSQIKAQDKSGKIQNEFGDLLEPGTVNFGGMKDGLWCYYSFMYNSKDFNTSIAPVADAFNNNIGLFQITSAFDSVDHNTHTIVPNDSFNNTFSTSTSDTNSTPKNINVFFLIKSGKNFPSANNSNGIKNSVLVLNEYELSDGTTKLLLKKVGGKDILIDDNMFTNFNSSEYLHNTKTFSCSKFSKTKFDPWKAAFNFSSANNFQLGTKPKFLTDDMMKNLEKLANFIK